MRGIDRRVVQRGVDDSGLHLGRDRSGAARTRGVLAQSFDAAVQETLTPQRHLAPAETHLHRVALGMCGDSLVAPGDMENELLPLRSSLLHAQPGQRVHLVAGVFEH